MAANFSGWVSATCLALKSPVRNMRPDATNATTRPMRNPRAATSRLRPRRTYQALMPVIRKAAAATDDAMVCRYRGIVDGLNTAARKSVRTALSPWIS